MEKLFSGHKICNSCSVHSSEKTQGEEDKLKKKHSHSLGKHKVNIANRIQIENTLDIGRKVSF
jgi:hypothetical protein